MRASWFRASWATLFASILDQDPQCVHSLGAVARHHVERTRAAVRPLVAALAAIGAVGSRSADGATDSGWEVVVLGIAQDAGIPQLGCEQALCTSIRDGKRAPERVSSLGVVNRALNKAYLFDATPDMPSQIHALTGGTVRRTASF